MVRPSGNGTERSMQRIEALSDGVFAIAITLLVLDLRIPATGGSDSRTLLDAILGLWPSYLAYGHSFTMIEIYWTNHHYLFKLFARTDHGLNLLNLLLISIAFLPFPTHVFGTHWPDEASRPVAVTLYAVGLVFPAAAWLAVRVYASHNRRLVRHGLDQGFVRTLTFQFLGTLAGNALAVAVSVVDHRWGPAIRTGLTFFYLLPPRTPIDHGGGESSAQIQPAPTHPGWLKE